MRLHLPYLHIAFLAALCLPYCINLGTSSIWDANEAFYAETPREMLESGDYLAPRFNFEPRAQKPPLTYWAILASYKLFGISEFAVRLPIALAAIGVLLFSYGIARMLFNPRAALIAAAVTATVARIFILARRLPIDILLMFFLMGTLFFLVRAILGACISVCRAWFSYQGTDCPPHSRRSLSPMGTLGPPAKIWRDASRDGSRDPDFGDASVVCGNIPGAWLGLY
jgi:4-amino-4-deoxy-L-arabinose transferase-like glycosyltransferase